jgi:hypothetical protein
MYINVSFQHHRFRERENVPGGRVVESCEICLRTRIIKILIKHFKLTFIVSRVEVEPVRGEK